MVGYLLLSISATTRVDPKSHGNNSRDAFTQPFADLAASVERLLRIRLLLQKVEQTLHQHEGSFGLRSVPLHQAPLVLAP